MRVTGRVAEFETGANLPDATVTQLTAIESMTSLGRGEPIRPVDLRLPMPNDSDLERVEGMLVTLRAPALTINQNHFQSRYGQLTLSAVGRVLAPTERHRPGSAPAIAQVAGDAGHRIVLDDASSSQHPVPTPHLDPASRLPRTGDRVGPITGVIDFGLTTQANPGPGGWRIHPTATPTFSVANPRPQRPPAVGGTLRIAGFALQNYFTTFQDGTTMDGTTGAGCTVGTRRAASHCRGANNRAEFDRQQAKIVAALVGLDADAVGLTEVQNDGNRSVEHLTNALNARVGAGTYASVTLPPEGTGSDAIRVALLYRRSALRPIGAATSDVDQVNHRPTLAQTFEHDGRRFVLLVSHFKSRRGCPTTGDADALGNIDAGDGQGCWNARRLAQAQRLRVFTSERQAAAGTDLALVIGDLNAYSREDPVDALTRAGAVDLVARHDPNGYTHVFDGAAGRLDHAIATPALAAHVTGAAVWHINADEPVLLDYNLEFKAPASGCGAGRTCPADLFRPDAFRSSDHDPVVIGDRPGHRQAAESPESTPEFVGAASAAIGLPHAKLDASKLGWWNAAGASRLKPTPTRMPRVAGAHWHWGNRA